MHLPLNHYHSFLFFVFVLFDSFAIFSYTLFRNSMCWCVLIFLLFAGYFIGYWYVCFILIFLIVDWLSLANLLFVCRVTKSNIIQSNPIQSNPIQYNTIQYNTIQYNTIQYNTIQYNTIQSNSSLFVVNSHRPKISNNVNRTWCFVMSFWFEEALIMHIPYVYSRVY